MIVIPSSVIKAVAQPKQIIIAGLPKTGKTTLAATIPDSLILDLEDGCRYVDARAVRIETIDDLRDVVKQLRDYKQKEGKPMVKRLVLDSVTKLEAMLENSALERANKLFGKWDKDGNLVEGIKALDTMAYGAGYNIRKEVVMDTLNLLQSVCETFVIIAHIVEKKMLKNGINIDEQIEANYKCLDAKGKLGEALAQGADALGMVYTKDNNTIGLSFKGGEDYRVSGCRMKDIAGKEIDIIKDGKADWSTIFNK